VLAWVLLKSTYKIAFHQRGNIHRKKNKQDGGEQLCKKKLASPHLFHSAMLAFRAFDA